MIEYRQPRYRDAAQTLAARVTPAEAITEEQQAFIVRLVALRLNRGPGTIPEIADELNVHSDYVAEAKRRLGALAVP